MHRFFTNEIQQNIAVIRGEDVKHITRVLRLQLDEEIQICDGNGKEGIATILSLESDRVTVSVSDFHPSASEPECKVTLYQGLPKTGKMETIIQKCVELGIETIVPMLSKRCVVQPKESFQNRITRWQRVSLEAAKQSKRGKIPTIQPLIKCSDLPVKDYDLVLVAYELEQSQSLKEILKNGRYKSIALVIGPEGGFEESEISDLIASGARSVSLGARILRTETAGMAMLAQVLYEVEG